MMTPLLIY